MDEDPWDLLRVGKRAEAFHLMRERYSAVASASHSRSLGAAYLFEREYKATWELSNEYNQRFPKHNAATYELGGAASWCLGNPAEAVEQWRAGLGCDYADGAGGAKLPLLLFFASVTDPKLFPRPDAEKLLQARADDPRARNWPGPISRFGLGRVDEGETAMRHMTADFYVGVIARARANHACFAEMMQRVARVSWSDFDSSRKAFITRVRQGEFSLARHEARDLTAVNE